MTALKPNLGDVASTFLADRATMPMALVRCIQSTYARCQNEARKASDLRSPSRDLTRLGKAVADLDASIHDAKYHMLCEMLGDQSRLMMLGFLTERPECGCPEVYAKIDHAAMGDRVGEPWITICQNPACPGDRPETLEA